MKKILALMLIGVMLMASNSVVVSQATDGKVSVSLIGRYDSADTAAIRSIDVDKREIRFRNHSTGKTYTLSYDNTSMMYDIYGRPLSARLLEVGQIVDVTFLKSTKHITTLDLSRQAWTIGTTRDHDLVRYDGTALVQGTVYKIDPRALIIAEGQLALAEDILATDTITVSGIGNDIYSVVVNSGHGYVSLSSEMVENQSLVGAWLELDNEVIHKISPNMLLSAPEGDYTLQILGNGANYQTEVNISRNQETVVDTSEVNISRPKEGLVTFEIEPETAEVFVDGERVLTKVPQTVQYGYHNLKIVAEGYITQTKYLKVGTPKSVISISLEKDSAAGESSSAASASTLPHKESTDADKSSKDSSRDKSASTASTVQQKPKQSVSENSSQSPAQNQVIEGYKIYVDEPNGAELYFDGSYIGMIPCSIPKISGNHEVILKKDGYETKSYRIHIDTSKTDLDYKFPPMVKIQTDDDSSSSATTASSSSSDASSDASSEMSSDSSSDASSEASSGGSDSSSDASSEGRSDDSGSSSSSDGGNNSGSTEISDAASTASASLGD